MLRAAFEAGVCLPGLGESDDDDEFLDIDTDSESHTSDDEFSIQQLDEVLKDIPVGPERLACFAHTLQLCIKDGMKPAAALLSTLQKAAKLVKHVKNANITCANSLPKKSFNLFSCQGN